MKHKKNISPDKLDEKDLESPSPKTLKTEFTDWMQDSSLPSDWFIAKDENTVKISNHKGDIFKSRKEAIDYMIQNQQPPTDIFTLWNTLHLEGWVCDENNLPSGWRMKKMTSNSCHYLSPMMDVFTSAKDLLTQVCQENDYSQEDVEKVRKWIEKC